MKILPTFLLLLALLTGAHALPTGTWMANYDGVLGTIRLEPERFEFEVSQGEAVYGFSGPVVSDTSPEAGRPGRLIIGPVTGSRAAYEVVWYFEPEASRARFFFAEEGFDTLEQANDSLAQFSLEQADPFMAEPFYREVSALAAMPNLSRDQFLQLLQEVVKSRSASFHQDVDLLIDDLVIARGYDPVKSHESFSQAMDTYGQDPEIKPLLEELAR